jgi:hypothetical protein
MGILDRLFPTRATQTANGQYIPANDNALARTGNAIADTGSAMLGRAGELYKAHPKKIQALGLLAGAILLSRMKRGR